MPERRLPVKQLVVLSICRFAEPLALTSAFPYLPEMIESFGIPQNDIARWAGITSAAFSLCQSCAGIPWGTASDTFGRKPMILIGLINTSITTLLWGFSTSLPMAIVARAFQGLGSGNVGILRTTVAELCPWKELQPRAFSVMPLIYQVGAIIGPTLGGALSNPLGVDPKKPRGNKFLERYPYCIPNLVTAAFFCIGIVTGWLFLKETLETKKNKRDIGLILGAKITAWLRSIFNMPKVERRLQHEREPLLDHSKPIGDEEVAPESSPVLSKPESAPRLKEILSYQTCLNLVVYTLLALYTLAYDQLLPVFMHHPSQPIDHPDVHLPLKFAGGFGIDHTRIGIIFTCFAVSSMLCQFLIMPPVARRLGVLRCLRLSFLIFPIIFFLTPFVSLLPTPVMQQVALVILLMIRGVGGTFAFPTSTIMLTNSASSLRVLGSLNGLAVSVSALGRAAGPAIGGSLFTFGVNHGYVIVPFWAMSVISIVALIPTWWLVEGKGFGDDPDSDVESVLSASAPSADSPDETTDHVKPNEVAGDTAMASESEYGDPSSLLSYVSTRSSAAVASDDETDEEVDDVRHHTRGGTSNSMERARSQSQSRRNRAVRRRSSVPLGMGVGFRRLSSNLGSTGIGGAGTSWGGT